MKNFWIIALIVTLTYSLAINKHESSVLPYRDLQASETLQKYLTGVPTDSAEGLKWILFPYFKAAEIRYSVEVDSKIPNEDKRVDMLLIYQKNRPQCIVIEFKSRGKKVKDAYLQAQEYSTLLKKNKKCAQTVNVVIGQDQDDGNRIGVWYQNNRDNKGIYFYFDVTQELPAVVKKRYVDIPALLASF